MLVFKYVWTCLHPQYDTMYMFNKTAQLIKYEIIPYLECLSS